VTRHSTIIAAVAAAALTAVVGCERSAEPVDTVYEMSALWTAPAGPVPVGAPIPDPPRVRVVDGAGRPRIGVPVRFGWVRGAGTLIPNNVVTDAAGEASVAWTLSTVAGLHEVRAYLADVSNGAFVSFPVTLSPGAPSSAVATIAPVIDIAGTAPLAVSYRDVGGNVTTAPASIVYSSANPGVATVSIAGVVTGVAPGNTVVTATAGSIVANAPITVRAGNPFATATEFTAVETWKPVFLPSRTALIPSLVADEIARFDATTGNLVAPTLALPGVAIDLDVSPDGAVAVAVSTLNELHVIDVAGNAVTKSIALPAEPSRVVLTADATTAYVSFVANSIARVDLASETVTTLAVGGSIHAGLLLSPDESVLYVSSNQGRLVRITTSPFVITDLALLTTPQGMALSPDGSRLYVASHEGPLRVFNPTNLQAIATSAVNATFDVRVSADGLYLVAARAGNSDVVVLDATTLEVYSTHPVAGFPRRIGIEPVTGAYWIGTERTILLRIVF